MQGKVRVAWFLLTITSLLTFILGGGVVYAAPFTPHLSGQIELKGPIELTLTVSPAVARPRDPVSISVTLTNRQATAATPELLLTIPPGLSQREQRLPTGTTFNYQDNSLTWYPVLPGNGGSASLQLDFVASVADIAQPTQTVRARLQYDDKEHNAGVNYWVGLPPTMSVGATPAVVTVGQPVQLSAITTGPGPFVQSWDLGDGRELTANNPQVVFAAPGSYQVTGKVSNPLAVATASTMVTVVAQPTAAFSVDDILPVVSQPVQFTNQSGGQPPLSYQWDFGDGTMATEANPSHQYMATGTYVVRLLVQSEHGVAESSQSVTVGTGPISDFVIDGVTQTGLPVHGQAYGDETVSTFRWDMGDGRQLEGETVDHVYYQPGDYLVTVQAGNEFGTSETSHWVHVEAGDYRMLLPLVMSSSNLSESPVAAPQPVAPLATEPVPVAPTAPTAPAEDAVTNGSPLPGIAEEPVPVFTAAPTPVPPPEPIVLPPQTALPAEATDAEQLLWYINEARRLHNLPPLSYNYELSIAAQVHSEDMAGNPDIMHDGSDGSRPAERQRRYGYLGLYGGEAVAWGWDSPVPVVEFWVNSPPHRTLILNPNAREVGIGFFADGTAPNIWYWTAEFGIRLDSDLPEGSAPTQ